MVLPQNVTSDGTLAARRRAIDQQMTISQTLELCGISVAYRAASAKSDL